MPHLFEPLTLRSVSFPNRVGVSPMCEYSGSHGVHREERHTAPPAVPAQPPVDATAHRHLGFYFHVDLGAAFFLTEAASGELGAGTAGAAALVSVAAGCHRGPDSSR